MFRIKEFKTLPKYQILIRFEDGVEGTVDLSHLAGHGIFAEWLEKGRFESVQIGASGELKWGENIDLCPDSLYLKITGKKPGELFPLPIQESVSA